MKLKRILCAALAVSILALSGCSGSEEKQAVDISKVKLSALQISEVSSKTDKELTDHKFSGGAVITLNTNTVFEKSYGYTSEKKNKLNDSGTQYQISSVTKVFTGAAIAIMCDEGVIQKNDVLPKFFPTLKNNKEMKSITVEDLLLKKRDFGRYVDNFVTTTDQLQTYNKLVNKNEKLANSRLKQDITRLILNMGPNNSSNVGDSNYYLLGKIIEKATGKDYRDYIKEKIIKKLGLKNTSFASGKRPMTGYNNDMGKWRYTEEQPTLNSYGYLFSSFGITSSPKDVAKFFSALVNKTLTKTDIIREAKRSSTNFGYGMSVEGRNLHVEGRTYLHSSYVFVNPENLECATLLSNTTGKADISEIGKDIHRVINSKINGILLESVEEKSLGL